MAPSVNPVIQDLGLIGSPGGYGQCRLFTHSDYNSGKPLVKKINLDNTPENLRRFRREQAIQNNLSGLENFVEIFSPVIRDSNGDYYYFMELAQGGTLKEYIEANSSMTTDERLDLIEGLCNGLIEAHSRGYAHRDFHYKNVLIKLDNGKPVPVIVDFGRARDFNRPAISHGNQILMMPYLLSPEALFQKRWDDVRAQYESADIYALGLLIHGVMSGQFGASRFVPVLFGSIGSYMYLNQLTMAVTYAPVLSNRYGLAQREQLYADWLATNNINTSSLLRVIASDKSAQFNNLINEAIQGAVTLDDTKRYNSVVELLQRIQNARSW